MFFVRNLFPDTGQPQSESLPAQRESSLLIPRKWSLSPMVTSWDQVRIGPAVELECLLLNRFNSLVQLSSKYLAGGTNCRSSKLEAICFSCSAFTVELRPFPLAVSHSLPAKFTKSGDRAKARP